ncbi:MAG: peptidase family protein [Acidimicrobiales bacterium]|nr:peptidase family protein [Acidimicrobiales bacterium]
MSPIPVEQCVGGADLTEPRLSPDGRALIYGRSIGGESALVLARLDGDDDVEGHLGVRSVLTSSPVPRTGRGLGGGCFCWLPDSSAVIYAATDGNLWQQPIDGGEPIVVTCDDADLGPGRAAQAPTVTPTGDGVVFVVDQREVWFQPLPSGPPLRLDDSSADFCFDAAMDADGTGAVWQAWNVPDMAWDASRVQSAPLVGGRVTDLVLPTGAVQQPRPIAGGPMLCVRDDSGWNNLWLGDEPLVDEAFEHGGPTWGLGQRSFAANDDGTAIAFTRNERGFGRLCVVDVATRQVSEVARGVHGQLSWSGSRLAALRSGARTPTQIVVYDTTTWARDVVAVGPHDAWSATELVEPELIEVPTRDGAIVHARLYRRDQDDAQADDVDEAPAGSDSDRLMCFVHGGPTDQWQVTFMPRVAFWRSQGYDVLVVDHRGSTGHGREYQQAMNGRWGEVDVADLVDAVRHAHRNGWGIPARTVLVGGSAGGFTVLGALAADPRLAAAGVVSYPVTDLFDLSERSHRFERHYTHHLVGPVPEVAPADGPYVDRSPVSFAARITTPLLMFHGEVDPVVPVEQSRVMATRIAEANGIVALVTYPDEGHGFRQRDHQLDEYRRTMSFLADHFV